MYSFKYMIQNTNQFRNQNTKSSTQNFNVLHRTPFRIREARGPEFRKNRNAQFQNSRVPPFEASHRLVGDSFTWRPAFKPPVLEEPALNTLFRKLLRSGSSPTAPSNVWSTKGGITMRTLLAQMQRT